MTSLVRLFRSIGRTTTRDAIEAWVNPEYVVSIHRTITSLANGLREPDGGSVLYMHDGRTYQDDRPPEELARILCNTPIIQPGLR